MNPCRPQPALSSSSLRLFPRSASPRDQVGITTLLISILLLLILAAAIVFSANVAMFDQRSSASENRAKLAQHASEGALNLAIEFIKANSGRLASNSTGGWLNSSSTPAWVACNTVTDVSDGAYWICQAESNVNRRNASRAIASLPLSDMLSSTASDGMTDQEILTRTALNRSLIDAPTGTQVATNTKVGAILCQMDPDAVGTGNPCSLSPGTGAPTAVTLVSCTSFSSVGEAEPSGFDPCWGGSSSSDQRQFFSTGHQTAVAISRVTLATFRSLGEVAKAPLVASGTVQGLGDMEIVAAPNGGGTGVAVSIWSPCPVDFEVGTTLNNDPQCPATGAGIGTVRTCHLGDFLGGMPAESLLDAKSGCAASPGRCSCPSDLNLMISRATAGSAIEGVDILDIDSDAGVLADIDYFPRAPHDNAEDHFDDSLFEVIFHKDVVAEDATSVSQNCGSGSTDCARNALSSMKNIRRVTACSDIPDATGGFFWVQNDGNCSLPSQAGSPVDPVVIVIEGGAGSVTLQGNATVFGMVFIRSSTHAATLRGGSTSWMLFGALVVEGQVNLSGMTLVYSEAVMQALMSSPSFQNYGVIPGSWLDARTSL